jgi:lipopolysaccharide/colanic/teichoic acid biosynthesis glycosyltransferase
MGFEFQVTLVDAILIPPTKAALPAGTVRADVGPSKRHAQPTEAPTRTVWGFDPVALHTRFWASQGVQVVRQGEPSAIVDHAELYLLTDSGSLTLFKLAPLMDVLNWVKPHVLFVRLHDVRERSYRENVVTDSQGRFVRFQRLYDATSRPTRVALTPDRDVAQLWQSAPSARVGWRRLRRYAPRPERAAQSVTGTVYDRTDARELAYFMHDLVAAWQQPDSTIMRAVRSGESAWRDAAAKVHPQAKLIGPIWIGAGRIVGEGETVVGPAVVWDDPGARPQTEAIEWLDLEPSEPSPEPIPRGDTPLDRLAKRGFDIAFAMLAILLTLPLYPFILLAIWLEDGRPFFFGHKRETRGGREFRCWKFRSMRKDAESMKAELAEKNQADGPQFYMDHDPRLLRVGRLLRKYNLDEFPQFFNVLLGQMSVVGPRPSPRQENQFCPGWREARLSVRPGITGLWQIKRTRRRGNDFQEWIRYDIEYVERRNWRLDLYIIWKTISTVMFKVSRS